MMFTLKIHKSDIEKLLKCHISEFFGHPGLHHTLIVIIFAIKMNSISVQCNITAAFIHGWVTETIYVHQPRGFNRGKGDEVLHLKQTLYGLKQSPQYFFHYLTELLIKQGLMALQFDPCLFISSSLIVIIYVDKSLIYMVKVMQK